MLHQAVLALQFRQEKVQMSLSPLRWGDAVATHLCSGGWRRIVAEVKWRVNSLRRDPAG